MVFTVCASVGEAENSVAWMTCGFLVGLFSLAFALVSGGWDGLDFMRERGTWRGERGVMCNVCGVTVRCVVEAILLPVLL